MRILIFLLFSLFIESSELNLQSQDKVAGDVLSSSQWNEIIKKIQSSNKLIEEEMLTGNWLCSSESINIRSGFGWTNSLKNPGTTSFRSNFPLTFQPSTLSASGTWSSSEEDFFYPSSQANGNVKEGYFILTTNSIFLNTTLENQTDPVFSAIYNLSFHGDSRFSAISNISELPSGLLYSFYCDKQS